MQIAGKVSWGELSPSSAAAFEFAMGCFVVAPIAEAELRQPDDAPKVTSRSLLVGILEAHAHTGQDDPAGDLLAHFGVARSALNSALASVWVKQQARFDPALSRRVALSEFPRLTDSVVEALQHASRIWRDVSQTATGIPLRFLFGGLLQVSTSGAFRTLSEVLPERADLPTLATKYGESLAERREASLQEFLKDFRSDDERPDDERSAEPVLTDNMPTLLDRPSLDDHLGRSDFAEILAKHILWVRKEEKESLQAISDEVDPGEAQGKDRGKKRGKKRAPRRSFMLHIDGPWGVGKSSLLMLLERQLKHRSPGSSSVVVKFNAWQRQHIDPPWWSLLEAVYVQSLRQVSHFRRWKLRLFEQWWRFRRGGAPFVLAFLGLAVISATFWFIYRGHPGTSIGDVLSTIAIVVAILGTAWAGLLTASRRVLLGSAQAAKGFAEAARDPMGEVKEHHEALIRWIRDPVAILVDDLDRCQGEYVVRLLEGIQTLFADSPVTYVVAADRRWLYTSFENVYEKYRYDTHEQGQRLGSLFLEKTFQLSVAVPGVSSDVQEEFWRYLIRVDQSDQERLLEQKTHEADRRLESTKREEDVLEIVQRDADSGQDPVKTVALRRAAAKRLAAPDIRLVTQHRLMDFGPLLDANPRSMIRFVNAYSVQRSTLVRYVERLVEPEHLAELIIIDQRWPLLLDRLQARPDLISEIGTQSGAVPDDVRELFANKDVQAVVTGERDGQKIGSPLTKEAIEAFGQLRIPHTPDGSPKEA